MMQKKLLLLLVALCIFLTTSKSCDSCGASINTSGLGLLAHYKNNWVGINWQFAGFKNTSKLESEVNDAMHVFNVSLQYYFTDKFKINIDQPYEFNKRTLDDRTWQVAGISDTRIWGTYTFFQNKSLTDNTQLYWETGMGARLPTGKHDADIHNKELPENFNPGNGSFGFLFNSNFILTYKDMGIAYQTNYQHNLKSNAGYRYGHQMSHQLICFWQPSWLKKLNVIPLGGARMEIIHADKYSNQKEVPGTSGNGVFAMAGLNVKTVKWLVSCAYMYPIAQNYGAGELRSIGRFSCRLAFAF